MTLLELEIICKFVWGVAIGMSILMPIEYIVLTKVFKWEW